MAKKDYSEDLLIQAPTAERLEQLGWESLFAWDREDFGPDSLLGRRNDTETVLTREVLDALRRLNPGLPEDAYQQALAQVLQDDITKTLVQLNAEKYRLLRDGVPVQYRDAGGRSVDKRLRLIDFDDPSQNRYIAVRELWIRGRLWRRRPDLIGFVNGLPLVFIELKRFEVHIDNAYKQNYADYLDTIPHLFHWNQLVILSNGHDAQYGSITATREHFHRWKRLDENDPEPASDQPLLPILLDGMLHRRHLLDIAEYIETAKQAATLDDPWTDAKEDKLYRELARDYPILTAPTRLETVARHVVEHFHQRWRVVDNGGGKALLVCLDKITCVRMHDLIVARWREKTAELEARIIEEEARFAVRGKAPSELLRRRREQLDWMKTTDVCVVVSPEQGEVAEFAKWRNFRGEPLDIRPHREKMVKRDLEQEFKQAEHPFRLAIVCAMWLTGFDVKCLATLYLDKPMRGHTLMTARSQRSTTSCGPCGRRPMSAPSCKICTRWSMSRWTPRRRTSRSRRRAMTSPGSTYPACRPNSQRRRSKISWP
jgi:type I site-specific restriction-modification system R (restriction) subunit